MDKRKNLQRKAPASVAESELRTSTRNRKRSVHSPRPSLARSSVSAAAASFRDTSPSTMRGSMARLKAFAPRRGEYFDEDEDERDVDEEDGEYEEEDGEYEVEDDSIYVKEETMQKRSSISTMKRRQEAAAAVGFTLYDKGAGAVVGGKLDAAIRSEMRNAYPDVQQHEIEAKWKGMMEILDREIRYVFLLNFQHAVPGLKEGIIAKIAPDFPWCSRTHASLRASIMDKSKQMRYNVLKSLQLHVKTAVQDAPDLLEGCLSMEDLVEHFQRLYTPENFLQAFGFIQHYIDIKISTDLGQYYMEEVYSHYCAKTELFLDWESDPEREAESPYNKARLVEFMEQFPTVANFDRLERDDFHELTIKRIRNRPDKPVEPHGLVRGTDFFPSREAPPPSKRQRLSLRSGSASVCG
ncbi:hypothetical protein V501_04822 [Pseudogymnoascus sp. VKM F-4519 (FW-2642)]|nr:hypothetical protein V501_04822 [Pseudogymnoascus sp. VKM F-4519 (FW-2642)]